MAAVQVHVEQVTRPSPAGVRGWLRESMHCRSQGPRCKCNEKKMDKEIYAYGGTGQLGTPILWVSRVYGLYPTCGIMEFVWASS